MMKHWTRLAIAVLCILPAFAETPHLKPPLRPHVGWWREQGIVVAGAWEPFLARVRQFDTCDTTMREWTKEQTDETARRLKERGSGHLAVSSSVWWPA